MRKSHSLGLGAICPDEVVLHNGGGGIGGFRTYAIAADSLSERRILDSSFSTPARYVQEIFLRCCESSALTGPTAWFVFNPLFATDRASILATLATLCSLGDWGHPLVLSDPNNLPIGYLLPPDFAGGNTRYLGFLSTVDAMLDAQLLEQVSGCRATVVRVGGVRLRWHARNGFDYLGLRPVYAWLTQCAISELRRVDVSPPLALDLSPVREPRASLPLYAIMPHHAGDILFLALACNEIRSLYRGIVVQRIYADIVRSVAPNLEVICIDPPPISGGDGLSRPTLPDSEYFRHYMSALPQGALYSYFRPSRNCYSTGFHLIDQFAFALGYSPRVDGALVSRTRPAPARIVPIQAAGAGARVLLHFDAGWPLKIYPHGSQSELIERLLAQGHKVTVLAPAGHFHPGVQSITFDTLADFVALARSQDIIVGMDSFPSHYCAHILGLPTVCLFASTRRQNADAPRAGHYIALEEGLRCSPCGASIRCPVYGGSECRNFVAPSLVADTVRALLAGIPRIETVETIAPTPSIHTLRTVHIDLRHLSLQAWLARLIPTTSYGTALLSEFLAAIRREGMSAAMRRSIRFLAKKFNS